MMSQPNTRAGGNPHRFASPARVMRAARAMLPWAAAAAAVLFAAGLYLALFASPIDYQQGETVRIMYVHVPSAWMAMFLYASLAAASLGSLVWRHPAADLYAEAASPVGAAFTLLALVTGSLWGQPMWGTWWVWDARLTSVLVLFFLYLGHMALLGAFDERARGARAAAVLALVGAVNLPIIKFSVDWWNTLHQPSTAFTSTVDPSMRTPLLISGAGFLLLFIALHLKAMQNEILRRRVKAMRLAEIARGDEIAAAAGAE